MANPQGMTTPDRYGMTEEDFADVAGDVYEEEEEQEREYLREMLENLRQVEIDYQQKEKNKKEYWKKRDAFDCWKNRTVSK